MKIIVTGSSGFVGKALVEKLRKKGHEVKEFDLSKGDDLLNKQQVKQAVKGVQVVYHLAAILDEKSPLLKGVNVKGTEILLEKAAKRLDPSKVIILKQVDGQLARVSGPLRLGGFMVNFKPEHDIQSTYPKTEFYDFLID